MDIIFKGRRTDVPERFRQHASAKLSKIEKLDHKAIRIDVEVSQERNPRQADRRERVELTIRSRGPVIRAEAAADDRYAALDRALAKLDARLRRASRRRRPKRGSNLADRVRGLWGGPRQSGETVELPAAGTAAAAAGVSAAGSVFPVGPNAASGLPGSAGAGDADGRAGKAWHGETGDGEPGGGEPGNDDALGEEAGEGAGRYDMVPIHMDGDGPVVVREKYHVARPMSIDQALLEMELVGHDFYLFRDQGCGYPSVVYRRHGYDYGLIRLVEEAGVPQMAGRPRPHP